MKKTFKIASYDFRRILLNPITYIALFIVLISSLVFGFVFKPNTASVYSANVSGSTTQTVYENFLGTKAKDTKTKLDSILSDAENFLNVQNSCYDELDLEKIWEKFSIIREEVKKHVLPNTDSEYVNDITEIETATSELKSFVDRFSNLGAFESNLIFTENQFKSLEELSSFFYHAVEISPDNNTLLIEYYNNLNKFDALEKIVFGVYVWNCDEELLENLKTEIIDVAKAKNKAIKKEMDTLNDSVTISDIESMQDMKNLATNYKLCCESAKFAVETELKLILEKKFNNLKNLYHFEKLSIEDTKLALSKALYFLNSEELYYKQHQTALNFNSASYEKSLYDYSYSIISVIGFLTVLFGIYCTYKLFGKDRKNGKMDTVLAQDVTFNQVFFGKTFAVIFVTSTILCMFTVLSLLAGFVFYPTLPHSMLAVFNLTNVYTIHPFLFLLIKVVGIELQAIFYSIITLFLMNISRKFELTFAIAILIFLIATVCNIFFNGSLTYCLFPFIHADLTSFLGGATMQTGFLRTSLFVSGNFIISIIYYSAVVGMLFNFTKQLFKKN